jgi:hypothetical protein
MAHPTDDARSGAQRSPEEYFKAALKGSLVGMVASASPALALGAAFAGLTLLLSGCGKTEELPEDAEEDDAEALPENADAAEEETEDTLEEDVITFAGSDDWLFLHSIPTTLEGGRSIDGVNHSIEQLKKQIAIDIENSDKTHLEVERKPNNHKLLGWQGNGTKRGSIRGEG